MPPHRNRPTRNLNVYALGPLGTPRQLIPCLYCDCSRQFRSKGGRTKHIKAYHQVDLLEVNVPVLSSPIPPAFSSQLSSQPPTPMPSSHTSPSPLPSHRSNDMSVEHPCFDLENPNFGDEMNENSPPGGSVDEQHVPNRPHITRAHHPKLDGKLIFLCYNTDINFATCRANL